MPARAAKIEPTKDDAAMKAAQRAIGGPTRAALRLAGEDDTSADVSPVLALQADLVRKLSTSTHDWSMPAYWGIGLAIVCIWVAGYLLYASL